MGQYKLRDTFVGTTTFSPNLGAGSVVQVLATRLANAAFTGQQLFQNTSLRIIGVDYHVASFNVGSGGLISAQTAATTIGSGATFEHHKKISAAEKDLAIDGIIGKLWARQEIPIDTLNGANFYSLGQGYKIFGAYYFGAPTGSLSRERHDLPVGTDIVTTGSGRELRLPRGTVLGSGAQLVIDAQVRMTLGAADTATVNIPDEDWVLNGIAARCYQAMVADAPGEEAGKYGVLAKSYAAQFTRDIGKFRDRIDSTFRNTFGEFVGV